MVSIIDKKDEAKIHYFLIKERIMVTESENDLYVVVLFQKGSDSRNPTGISVFYSSKYRAYKV